MDREATEERQIIPPIDRFRGARARNHACSAAAALSQRFAIVGRPGIVSSTIFAQQAMLKTGGRSQRPEVSKLRGSGAPDGKSSLNLAREPQK